MTGWDFSVKHMDAVRQALGSCPAGLFMGFDTATAKQDMEQATDLVMQLNGGTFAVRVRGNKYWDNGFPDMSIRYYCRGHKTEIHKIREGLADWYFCGWSSGADNGLLGWCIVDVNKMRSLDILKCTIPDCQSYDCRITDCRWPVNDNTRDDTSGMYIPTRYLWENMCITHSYNMGFTGIKPLPEAPSKDDYASNIEFQPSLYSGQDVPTQHRH